MTEVFRLRLLGSVTVKRGQKPVRDFESWKALALLCYVVVQGKPLSRVHLADLFWPSKSERRGRANLSRVLHNIRSLIPDILETNRQSVAFDQTTAHWVDIAEFDALVQQGDPSSLASAAELYRDEFMSGVIPDGCPDVEIWLAVERERWRQRVVQILDSLISYHARRGEYEDGLRYTARVLELERWREEAHRQRMQLLALSGQRTAALAQYEICCRVLDDELGVEPEPATTALYNRIRDAGLKPESGQPALDDDRAAPPAPAGADDSDHVLLPFIGRGDEYTWLVEQWKDAQRGNGKFTLAEGESGLGKTRLVNEVLRYVTHSGTLVLQSQCYSFGTEIPYHAIVPILRAALEQDVTLGEVWRSELATLLPEIREANPNLPDPIATSGETARQRLFEAIARLLLALTGTVETVAIFLDDLHLADQATLDLLQYAFHRLTGAPIWFLGAYRPEEIVATHPLNVLRRALIRERDLALLHLNPLDLGSIAQVSRSLSHLSDTEQKELVDYLFRESEGNAFILTHLLHDLTERDILTPVDDTWELDIDRFVVHTADDAGTNTIPFSVQEVILSRCERLSQPARQLIDLAAVLGEQFALNVLRTAAAPEIDIADALEELADRRLLTAHTGSLQYRFSHGMIQSVVYDQLSPARRQQLHARVATTLEQLYPTQKDRVVERLAIHYLEGGNRERAIYYHRRAAERAEQIYAWSTAIQHYTQVLALLPDNDYAARYDILMRREWAYNIIADHRSQKADLALTQELANYLDDDTRRAEVHCRQIKIALRNGHFSGGIEVAKQAIELAEETARLDIVAESRRLGALCWHNQGSYDTAYEWAQEALRLYEEDDNRQGRRLALNTLGVLARNQGYLHDAQRYMEEAVAEWRKAGDIWRLATGLSTLSILYYGLGEYARALEAQQEVRTLAPRTGDLHLEASSLNSLGLIYHAHGRYEEAMEAFESALATARSADAAKIEATALLSQAHTLFELGRVEDAERNYRRSLEMQDEIGSPVLRAETLNGLADCRLAQGEPAEALALLDDAEEWYRSSGIPGIGETLVRQAEAHVARGDVDVALDVITHLLDTLAQPDSRERLNPKTWSRARTVLETYDNALLERAEQLAPMNR